MASVVRPAAAEYGIWFRRTDLDSNTFVPARWDNVIEGAALCTRLQNSAGVEVSTVEHIMAAIAGCGIHNALIELSHQSRFLSQDAAASLAPREIALADKEIGDVRKLIGSKKFSPALDKASEARSSLEMTVSRMDETVKAALAETKQLVPFHHDPMHSDTEIDQLFDKQIRSMRPAFKVTPGAEGMIFDLR